MNTAVAMRSLLFFVLSLGIAVACGSDGANDGGDAVGDSDGNGTVGDGDGDGNGDGDGDGDEDGDGDGDGDGAGPCFPMQIQDDFSGPELDRSSWMSVGASGISAGVVDERLTFTPTPGFNNTRTVGLRSVSTFDLTECTMWVEVPRVLPPDVSGEVTWSLLVGDNNAFIRVHRPNIQFAVSGGGEVEESFVPFDETAHRWWRFRDEGGVLYLESSPTGSDWTVQLEHAHAWDLSLARMGFHVVVSPTEVEFDGPQFDNVNVAP